MRRRHGLSLLEVLLATAVLLGCVVVLGHLASIGRVDANSARDLADAQRICQNRMNELLTGLVPLQTSEQETLADEPGWQCTIAIEPAEAPGLAAVRVTVANDLPDQRHPVRFTLVRWLRDPDESDAADSSKSPLPMPPRFRGGR